MREAGPAQVGLVKQAEVSAREFSVLCHVTPGLESDTEVIEIGFRD